MSHTIKLKLDVNKVDIDVVSLLYVPYHQTDVNKVDIDVVSLLYVPYHQTDVNKVDI